MKYISYILIFLLSFYSCSENAEPSDNLLGIWSHDNELHNRISLELGVSKGNLSGPRAFGQIKMLFKANNTYIAFFDNLEYKGIWKIENNLLHMKRDKEKWIAYEYRLNLTELIIFDRDWLMTFIKNSES